MDIGIFFFATDYAIDIPELAGALEERGYGALFLPEHTHIPTSRRSQWPGGGELPREYSHTHDPFVALSFAAAATKKLKVGTGICLIAQRDPIVTAKAAASLDRLSNGRFIFGIGGGWNVEEMESHGTQYNTRFKKLEEHVRCIKSLWTEEAASFDGDFVQLEPSWSWPKPLQTPHPPIILGGETMHTMRRVARFCDGWFPRGRFGFDVVEGMAGMKQAADEVGRDPASISVTVFGAQPDPAVLDSYREAGVERALFAIPSEGRDTVLGLLDQYAPLINT